MGETVEQRPGQVLRAEGPGPFVEGEVGGDERGAPLVELYPKVDGAVKSCWPMACLYRSLRFGEEYLPVSALLVDKT